MPLNDKGKPWKDIIQNAGVLIPQILHWNPPGLYDAIEREIRKVLYKEKGIINAICKEKRDLTNNQATTRIT